MNTLNNMQNISSALWVQIQTQSNQNGLGVLENAAASDAGTPVGSIIFASLVGV